MRTDTHQRPQVATDQRYRRELGLSIYRLLKSNARNARHVFEMAGKPFPNGGMSELMRSRPVDAVRAEVGNTTLTVEITSQWHGEQHAPDAPNTLRYACYHLSDFQNWFAALLQRSGSSMLPPATLQVHEVTSFMGKPATSIRADLRPAPMFHRKKKGRR